MTSISKLIVGGFKSIRERTEIPIAPLTFLVGPNSAGKSALLEATRALVARAKEPWTDLASSQLFAESVFVRGTAYRNSGGLGEYDPSIATHLGVELSEFAAPDYFGAGDEASNFVKHGRAICHALAGSTISIEIEERLCSDGGAGQKLDSQSSLMVDQVPLLKFANAVCAHHKGLAENPIAQFDARGVPAKWNPLGCLWINLVHPVWGVAFLKSSHVSSKQLGHTVPEDELDFSVFKSILRSLVEKSESRPETPIRNLIVVEGNWLRIRTATNFLRCKQWTGSLFVDGDDSEKLIQYVIQLLGLTADPVDDSEFERMGEFFQISGVLEAIDVLGQTVSDWMVSSLHMTKVSGDRSVLSNSDVTTELRLSLINSLAIDEQSLTSPFAPNFALNGKRSSLIDVYALWLASIHLGPDLVDDSLRKKLLSRVDFINLILRDGLFGQKTQRYQVVPVAWLKTRQLALTADGSTPIDLDKRRGSLEVKLKLRDASGRLLDFDDVGSGISYTFPILAALMYAKTSWIAQPELHLHPAAQCEMGDVFIRALNQGHFSVIETHSEHVMLRVLKRIRQTTNGLNIDDELKCPPEAMSVLYFDPQADGSTKVKQLRVTRLGDFKDRWPDGFFEERGRELFDE